MNKIIIYILCLAAILLSSCQFRQNDIHVDYVTSPCLIPTPDNRFKLCDNMIIRVHKKYHAVPKGFKTDLASIPRIMWPFFAPSDYDSIAAAVLHDWLYCCVASVTRKKADEIFYFGLRVHGMHQLKASIYYIGVRSVGWMYYKHGKGLADHESEFHKSSIKGIYNQGDRDWETK